MSCALVCAAQLHAESMRAIDVMPGTTGEGCSEDELKNNSVCKLLATLFTKPSQWSCVEEAFTSRASSYPSWACAI